MKTITIVQTSNEGKLLSYSININKDMPYNIAACIHRKPGCTVVSIRYKGEIVYTDLRE